MICPVGGAIFIPIVKLLSKWLLLCHIKGKCGTTQLFVCLPLVGVGEGVGVLVLRSLRSVLAFEGSRAGDVLAMGGDPVVVLGVGGV